MINDSIQNDVSCTSLGFQNEVQLNANHTHFILYDDGSKHTFGKEVKFRREFEDYLSKVYKVPCVLIVIDGGYNTLKIVSKAIKNRTPVILIAVTQNFLFKIESN